MARPSDQHTPALLLLGLGAQCEAAVRLALDARFEGLTCRTLELAGPAMEAESVHFPHQAREERENSASQQLLRVSIVDAQNMIDDFCEALYLIVDLGDRRALAAAVTLLLDSDEKCLKIGILCGAASSRDISLERRLCEQLDGHVYAEEDGHLEKLEAARSQPQSLPDLCLALLKGSLDLLARNNVIANDLGDLQAVLSKSGRHHFYFAAGQGSVNLQRVLQLSCQEWFSDMPIIRHASTILLTINCTENSLITADAMSMLDTLQNIFSSKIRVLWNYAPSDFPEDKFELCLICFGLEGGQTQAAR